MSILETAGNSYIFEAKGLTPQAPAPDFSSLMGCALQLEPKLTLLFELVFSVLYHKNKQTTNNKTFQANSGNHGNHVSYRAAQVTVVVSISL